jgi:hypothetical protein
MKCRAERSPPLMNLLPFLLGEGGWGVRFRPCSPFLLIQEPAEAVASTEKTLRHANERARLLPSLTTHTLGRSLALPLDRCLLRE